MTIELAYISSTFVQVALPSFSDRLCVSITHSLVFTEMKAGVTQAWAVIHLTVEDLTCSLEDHIQLQGTEAQSEPYSITEFSRETQQFGEMETNAGRGLKEFTVWLWRIAKLKCIGQDSRMETGKAQVAICLDSSRV